MPQKSILITGCSSGIGLASAQEMKKRGWQVFATARKPEDLERLKVEYGLEAVHLELSDPASIAACADSVLERANGTLYALFNNAAYGQLGAVEDLSADILRQQLEVNVIGTHDLTRRLLPAMRRQGAGRIVQCSSVLGLVSVRYRGGYCASKFALEALSDSLRLELRETDVHVSLIEPGPIATNFVANALARFRSTIDIVNSAHRTPYEARLKKLEEGGQQSFKLPPESVAEKLVHAVESRKPRTRYYVTTPTYFAAGMKRVLPTALLDRILFAQ